MPEIDVSGAAQRLLDQGVNDPGKCLQHVWRAIGQGRHYLTGGGSDAFSTWRATPVENRHVGDRNVPKNMPAYLGVKNGNTYGDVMISRGDGTFAATDRPVGRVGICTLEQRMAQTGRPYLGWADSMGGYDLIDYSTAGDGGTPIEPEKEDDMATLQLGKHPNGQPVLFGEFTWEMIGAWTMNDLVALFGEPIQMNDSQWAFTQQVILENQARQKMALSDADLTKIGASVKPADLTPVLAAIAALDSQADDYQDRLVDALKRGLTGTVVLAPTL